MEAAVRLQTGYQERIDRGLDSPDDISPAGLLATRQIVIAHDTFRYRSTLDEALLAGDFSSPLEHDVLILTVERPTIAVSSLFSIDELHIGAETALVHLNVLPVAQDRTLAVLSYPTGFAAMARATLDRVLNSSGIIPLYELSRVVLANCENFCG
jgi:hypothetical protein